MTDTLPAIRVSDAPAQAGSPTERQDQSESLPREVTNKKLVAKLRNPTIPVAQHKEPHNGSNNDKLSEAAIDPLSQQIFQRTNTSPAIQKLRSPNVEPSANQPPNSPRESNAEDKKHSGETSRDVGGGAKADKKKGVSFLSRFIGGNKKKSTLDGTSENGSEADDSRPEGMDAQLYIDNFGFSPKHPQPPAYIKVRAKFKKQKEFDRLFLAQELQSGSDKKSPPAAGSNPAPQSGSAATQNPIWAVEFSRDGRYLAVGGQDRIIRVWAVISSAEERRSHERHESGANHLSAPVFMQKTYREYQGHTATILDLSWSKNNFLLSSSMDKTVRLWHVSRDENLCTFKHSDFIPSIQFHPTDDRFFLAGSLDSKLRLWSIPDKTVAFAVSVPEMITAVAFTPDGKTCIAGTLGGLCVFYDTEGLKWQSQLHVKSTRGQNAKGSKITGIQATHWPPGGESDEVKLMISSNDSRLRIYNLKDKTLEMKFKGHENNCSQIRATFVESSGHIICGSEDCKAYIWSATVPEGDKKNQRPVEMFEAHDSITTCTVFAPLQTKQLLSASEDPIYDMCNPPPVTLISKAESVSSSRAPTEAGSAHPTPAPTDTHFRKAPESPAYLARCAHHGGNIIITADYTGSLKVFRQDCAFTKRLRMREWDMASKKGRPSSILSRTSRSRRDSVSTQPPNDRIMTWRQDISNGSLHSPSGSIRDQKRRSMSPRKAMATLDASLATHSDFLSSPPRDAHNATHSYSKRPTSPSLDRTPARSAAPSAATSPAPSRAPTDDTSEPPSSAPLNLSSDANPLAIYNGQSWAFWAKADQNRERERQRPQLDARLSQLSQISRLTSEMSDGGLDGREETEQQRGSSGGRCAHCGGVDFVRVDGGRGWACKRCGEME